MLRIQSMADSTRDGIGQVRLWLASRFEGYSGLTRDRVRRLSPWLRQTWSRYLPIIRGRLRRALSKTRDALKPAALKRCAVAARRWAIEHDTVPQEATARRRNLLIERIERHDLREAERQQRHDEMARKREKKEQEDRQTYSVYFE